MSALDPVHGIETQRMGHDGWTWREPTHDEHFRRCGWCGSAHPADLAAEPVWHANWADWKYGWPHKFYVDIPNREPEALFAIGSTFGGPADRPLHPGYIAWDDLTDEQRAIYVRDHGQITDRYPAPRGVMFGTRPNHFGKFYTIHLADPAIDDAVKDAVQRKSGLRFDFVDGRVTWRAYYGKGEG